MTNTFEILRVQECPSWGNAKANFEMALTKLGIEGHVDVTLIQTQEEALKREFSGSPMILANGVDLFPISGDEFSLRCRVFNIDNKFMGWPTVNMIKTELSKATGII